MGHSDNRSASCQPTTSMEGPKGQGPGLEPNTVHKTKTFSRLRPNKNKTTEQNSRTKPMNKTTEQKPTSERLKTNSPRTSNKTKAEQNKKTLFTAMPGCRGAGPPPGPPSFDQGGAWWLLSADLQRSSVANGCLMAIEKPWAEIVLFLLVANGKRFCFC